MTYKIVKDRRAWWPVEWAGVDEEGAIVTNRIELRMRLMKVNEAYAVAAEVDRSRVIESTADEAGAAGGDAAAQQIALWTALVMRMADNWRGVEAENGEALPWSEANVALLVNEPGLFNHIFAAFGDAMNARERLREGN